MYNIITDWFAVCGLTWTTIYKYEEETPKEKSAKFVARSQWSHHEYLQKNIKHIPTENQ